MTEPLINTEIIERLHTIAENDELQNCCDISCDNCALYISHIDACLIDLTVNLYHDAKRRNDRRERK